MVIVGYQCRIKISQVLTPEREDVIVDLEKQYDHTRDNSWLCDPFGENITYGVEFNVNTGFSWDFFICVKSSERAEELGNTLLLYLQDKYKGLDGEMSVSPLYSEFLNLDRPLYEILLPSNEYLKFHLFRKIINYYKSPHRKISLNMFILWKKHDLGSMPNPKKYAMKIFVSLNPNKENFTNLVNQKPAQEAVLRYIISDMRIIPDGIVVANKVEYKELSHSKWKDILTCNVFLDREEYMRGSIPREELPTYVKPENVDFTIPKDIPLKKPPILENRNIVNVPISKDDNNYLCFGKKMIDGVISNEIATMEIDLLNNHLDLYGKSGKGKSTLIKIIIHQLRRKRPDVGILMINLADPNLARDFPMAKVYNFPSEKLKFPYIVSGSRVMKSIRGFGNILAACLGLKYVGPVIITQTLQRCYEKFRDFPHNINHFFDQVEKNLKAQPYDPEFQQRILMAFRRRINELFSNRELVNTLKLKKDIIQNGPDWISEWREGNLVILNLTELDDTKEQPLITMLILKMVEILTHYDNSKVLKRLICLDEAHRALGKSRDKDPESVEFIMKNNINSSFSNIIEECRKRGTGIVILEQKPYLLLDTAIDSAEIKILFGLGYPHNEIFTSNLKNREMLLGLKPQYAVVLNDLTEERYLCKIIDDEKIDT